jgi:hypothetical protein
MTTPSASAGRDVTQDDFGEAAEVFAEQARFLLWVARGAR